MKNRSFAYSMSTLGLILLLLLVSYLDKNVAFPGKVAGNKKLAQAEVHLQAASPLSSNHKATPVPR